MKHLKTLSLISLGVLFLMSVASIGIPAEKKSSVKSASSTKGAVSKKGVSKSNKVDEILSAINKATSLDSISRSISKANLSKKEVEELGKAMKKPTYSAKFKRLTAKAKDAKQKSAATKARNIEKKKQRDFKKAQNLELKRVNQETHRRLARTTMIDKPAAAPAMAPATMAFSAAERLEIEDPARVESIIPQPVAVGRDIYIRGENFGRTRGKVRIRTDLGSGELLVLGWHDDSISARIRANIQDIIGETEIEARVFVEATKNTAVGLVRVLPDPSRMSPHITNMPDEFTPGRYIIIEGDNFLSERPGTVEFRIGSSIFEGQVYDWQDTAIDVRLQADVSGLPRRSATVVVRNHAGNETSGSITFEPSKSIGVIFTIHTCSPFDSYEDIGWCSRIIDTYTDHDYELLNGWMVKNYYLEDEPMRGNTGGAGSRYRERPTIGATNGRSRVEIEVNSLVGWHHTATNFLIVEGPYGLPYR